MPYRLPPEKAVCGIRFQPIYSLVDKNIQAWEILSILHPELHHERYFSEQPDDVALGMLCWQLLIVAMKKNKQRYYLNAPSRLLCKPRIVERIHKLLRAGVVIEVQDPQAYFSLSIEERGMFNLNVEQIKALGAEVWIDDVIPEYIPYLNDKITLFDGVKIDKSVLHYTAYEPGILSGLITWCKARVKSVLVEGVENSHHFTTAASAGCQYLQGYLWPEERLSLRYMSVGDD